MNKIPLGLKVALLSLLSVSLSAQQEFGGEPLSFSAKALKNTSSYLTSLPKAIDVPMTMNVDDLLMEDEWGGDVQLRPYRMAVILPQKINFAEKADRIELQNGHSVYRLALRSEGAKAIGVYYEAFDLPEGSRLYIYDPGRTQLKGAYTKASHPTTGEFATSPILGDCVILEYETNQEGELPDIRISGLGHFYRAPFISRDEQIDRGEDSSHPHCQINVNCPEGDAWRKQIAGVCQIYMVLEDNGRQFVSSCTGNLLNNTAKDFAPLIISAAHCAALEGKFAPKDELLDRWIFSFHYTKPGCSNATSGYSYQSKSMVGCRKLAFLPLNGMSDGLLLKLKEEIPARYRVYYNGWDRREKLYSSAVGLHHPAGDAMKISVHKGQPKVIRAFVGPDEGAQDAHFSFHFDQGDTEGGSSGSSLFNQDGLVVGTLTGGGPGICLPKSKDLYGRMAFHWDKFASSGDEHQMAKFLDPVNGGKAETLEGAFREEMYPISTVRRFDVALSADRSKVLLAWQAPYGSEEFGTKGLRYFLFREGEKIADLEADGANLTKYQEDIPQSSVSHGVLNYSLCVAYPYMGGEQGETKYELGPEMNASVFVGDLITEITPQKESSSENTIVLSWEQPVYHQLLSKVGLDKKFDLIPYQTANIPLIPGRIGSVTHCKYREKWPMNNPLYSEKGGLPTDPLYITQINIIPDKAGDELYVLAMTDEALRIKDLFQKVVVPEDYKKGTWLRVPLKTPYEINRDQMLYVGFGAKNNASTDPGKKPNTIQEWADSNGLLNYEDPHPQIYVGRYDFIGIVEHLWLHPERLEGFPGVPSSRNLLAMQIVVSNSDKPLSSPIEETNFGGRYAVDTPIPTHYIIKRDGAELGRVEAKRGLNSFIDKTNSDPNKTYTVEVVYADLGPTLDVEVVDSEQTPSVYPSLFDTHLNLTQIELINRARLISIDGRSVAEWTSDSLGEYLDVSHIPSGTYIIVLDTEKGAIHQKLIKQ
ncbi:hypothetical protein HQ45_08655 [Porphyromonas crevioricanis]|uniref:T9SS type A sorting domain-containing protein n=1 Tax=Porphyromonas crevioricanis TaxID=393921 RepID=UPI00052C6BE2|nr:T9SS type A sorting domain-containing protein [Porphyromonas crevioricanis]KGN88755.1 hypothetical protein HQ45_08655 [Porphyromonas crevioricanis]